jgi:hypothetical protein
MAIASTAVAMAVAGTVVASTSAETARERPRGALEDCSTAAGWPAGSTREFTGRRNLVVGPLALAGAGVMFGYAESVGGNRLGVHVRGGHRVTLELSRQTRMHVGFAFGSPRGATRASKWNLHNTRRVVTFSACQRDEGLRFSFGDEWPVTAWVGFLLAASPRCVPLLVWVDDEPAPHSVVLRFGVRRCG